MFGMPTGVAIGRKSVLLVQHSITLSTASAALLAFALMQLLCPFQSSVQEGVQRVRIKTKKADSLKSLGTIEHID
jgi:hypothetical protein